MKIRRVALPVMGSAVAFLMLILQASPAQAAPDETPAGLEKKEAAPGNAAGSNGNGAENSAPARVTAARTAAAAAPAPAAKQTVSVQGKSLSTPDQNGKGPERDTRGTDKPGGTGGLDDDRDFNNGCGNDTDRDDDNEGWCGRKKLVIVEEPEEPEEPILRPRLILGRSDERVKVASVDVDEQLPVTGFGTAGFGQAATAMLVLGAALTAAAARRRTA